MNTTSLSVDLINEVVGNVAEQVAQTILSDGKVFSIGLGPDSASAQALSSLMRWGILRERPSLPVIELIDHKTAPQDSDMLWPAEQLRALGQSGDFAVIFATSLKQTEIDRLSEVAFQRNVGLAWFAAEGPGFKLIFPDAQVEQRLVMNYASAICLARLIDICTFGPLED